MVQLRNTSSISVMHDLDLHKPQFPHLQQDEIHWENCGWNTSTKGNFILSYDLPGTLLPQTEIVYILKIDC